MWIEDCRGGQVILAWLVDVQTVYVIAFVVDDIARTFHVGSFSKGLVGSASFFGMLFGAIFWSLYADRHGRRGAFMFSLGCIFVSVLASALAPSFVLFLVFRVLVGFGVGGNLPVTAALLTEFLPTNDRATVLCYLDGMFWSLGVITAALFGFLLMHGLGLGREDTMWRWLIGISGMPTVVVLLAYRLLPESPRYLGVVGRHDDAAKMLEEIATTNGKLDVLGLPPPDQCGEGERVRLQAGPTSDDPKGIAGFSGGGGATDGEKGDHGVSGPSRIRIEDEVEDECAGAGDVRELFRSPIMRRVTLCVWMVWLFINTSYEGMYFLLPRYYGEFTGERRDLVFTLGMIIGASIIPASFLAMWLCSEKRLGRVGTLKWTSFATALLIFAMALFFNVPALFIPVSILTMGLFVVPSIMKHIITLEVYTTKFRVVGLGSANIWTRVGGITAPMLAEALYDKVGPIAPLVVFGLTMILTGTFGGLVPIETAGRKLDDDSWDRKEPIEEVVDTEGAYSAPAEDA